MRYLVQLVVFSAFLLRIVLPAHAASGMRADVLDASFSSEHWLDARLELRFAFEHSVATIDREFPCYDQEGICPQTAGILTNSEIHAERTRQLVWIDSAFGLGPDVEIRFSMPYVFQDLRALRYAGGVGPENSTLVDNIGGQSLPTLNFDNRPKRRGLGDLRIGLRTALLSSDRSDTQPDLVLRAEYTMPTAPTMKGTNLAVGEGLHQVLMGVDSGCALNRVIKAHMGLSAKARIVADTTLYKTGFRTQHLEHPGPQVEFVTGLTLIPWAPGPKEKFLVVTLEGGFMHTAAGREPTLLFDALAGSLCSGNADCHSTEYYALPGEYSNGITDVQEHIRIGGSLEVRYRPGRYFEVLAGADFGFVPAHLLTSARYGEDIDQDGKLHTKDTLYGQHEFSPVFVEALDSAGSRLVASATVDFATHISLVARY